MNHLHWFIIQIPFASPIRGDFFNSMWFLDMIRLKIEHDISGIPGTARTEMIWFGEPKTIEQTEQVE